ncbi:hypothetical protein CLOM_g2933 [Closterium sp. NIES-68]|nr:hypothetical protein CLOM_g2933 [Closterium sp. NIES-68]GJP73414.1 hypothetical protein CLOP_g4130 [Closterium sp. NIES-67]
MSEPSKLLLFLASPRLLPLLLAVALIVAFSPTATADSYHFAELVDGESRAVIYLKLSFYSNASFIQAQYKIFAALPAGPPAYITLAGTAVPGCDPSKCSLPPPAPAYGHAVWAQPVQSVWVAEGTFFSMAGTDPERYSALLQLIDNSFLFPGVVMAYPQTTGGGLRPVMGQLRVDATQRFYAAGPIPAYVQNPQYSVRFLSYMPGGANISLSYSDDGLYFQVSFIFVVVVPTEEPVATSIIVNLQDAVAPLSTTPAGGCSAQKEKGKEKENRNNKGKSKEKGKDKPTCDKKHRGKKGEEDECCDDGGATPPPPSISTVYLFLYSNSAPCDLSCPSVIVHYAARQWYFNGLTPEALAADPTRKALLALSQFAFMGDRGQLVNATMKLAAIDQPNGPNNLLQRVI